MAINIGSNFLYQGENYLDQRITGMFTEVSQLQYFDKTDERFSTIPDGFEFFIREEWFTFLPNSSKSPEYGYFHKRDEKIAQTLDIIQGQIGNVNEETTIGLGNRISAIETKNQEQDNENLLLKARLLELEKTLFPLRVGIGNTLGNAKVSNATTKALGTSWTIYSLVGNPVSFGMYWYVTYKDQEITPRQISDSYTKSTVDVNPETHQISISIPSEETGVVKTIPITVTAQYNTDTGLTLEETSPSTATVSIVMPTWHGKIEKGEDEFREYVGRLNNPDNVLNEVTGTLKFTQRVGAKSLSQKMTTAISAGTSYGYLVPSSWTLSSITDDGNYSYTFSVSNTIRLTWNGEEVAYKIYYLQYGDIEFPKDKTLKFNF